MCIRDRDYSSYVHGGDATGQSYGGVQKQQQQQRGGLGRGGTNPPSQSSVFTAYGGYSEAAGKPPVRAAGRGFGGGGTPTRGAMPRGAGTTAYRPQRFGASASVDMGYGLASSEPVTAEQYATAVAGQQQQQQQQLYETYTAAAAAAAAAGAGGYDYADAAAAAYPQTAYYTTAAGGHYLAATSDTTQQYYTQF